MRTLALIPVVAVCIVVGAAIFILAALGPPLLLAWGLVAWVGCDPSLAILLAMAFGVPWAMLLPHILD